MNPVFLRAKSSGVVFRYILHAEENVRIKKLL